MFFAESELQLEHYKKNKEHQIKNKVSQSPKSLQNNPEQHDPEKNPFGCVDLEGEQLLEAKKILNNNPRIIDQYLVTIWIKNGKQNNRLYFPLLKKHTQKQVQGSPITNWYLDSVEVDVGKQRKILKKRTVGTKVSNWKKILSTPNS